MSYFNQSKYSTSTDSEVSNETDSLVEKGHKNVTKVDIGKFDDLCKNFKVNKDIKIKKLVGQDKEDFDLVVSYVHLLYGTNYYTTLYERVRKYFDNVTNIKPGTVGAYFAGCLISNKTDKQDNPGCSLSCAGSMPLPKDEEGWNFCDKAVFMAEKGETGYVFSVVKPANSEDEMDPAYLFVDSSTLHDFKGFSTEEKEQIRAFGCKKVKVVGFSSDMTYSDLYKEPKAVHEIKHRSNKKHVVKKDDNSGVILGVLILIIVLILILCLLGYRYYKN